MQPKPYKSFNFSKFDLETWITLKKEAAERNVPFQELIQMILKEWIDKNLKKE